MRRVSFLGLALVLALASVGCSADDKPEAAPTPPRPRSTPADASRDQLLVEADLRRVDGALALAMSRGTPGSRRSAARGLGLIGSDAALILLQRGLADPDPQVRTASSFGLSLAGLPADAWIGALAVEDDVPTRNLLLRDLGRALDQRRAGPLFRALDGGDPLDACAGITQLARRDPHLPASVTRTLLRHSAGPDGTFTISCLGALAVIESLRTVRSETEAAAIPSAGDPGTRADDPAVRALWAQVLAAQGSGAIPLLLQMIADPEPFVAAAAFTGLGHVVSKRDPRPFTAALATQLERRANDPRSHPLPLHAAFAAAPDLGDSVVLTDALEAAVQRLAPTPGSQPDPESAALHCSAARAFDRTRRWPSRSSGCGAGVIPDWVGERAVAEALAAGTGSDALRAAHLQRLIAHGSPLVRAAAFRAAATLAPQHAVALLQMGLAEDHLDVRASAADALSRTPPVLALLRDGRDPTLAAAVRSAFQAFHVTHHVPGLHAWLAVVRLARLRAELGGVLVLARHNIPSLRHDARSLLDEWNHPVPETPLDPVPNPISRDLLSSGASTTTIRLVLPTGPAVLSLDPALAPVTVARMIPWLQDPGRADLHVSAWQPGRSVQLTSVTDQAQPPWRSEESRFAMVRGTVAVAQHARDALAASLVILLTPQPELDGELTVIGRITDGMEHVDRLSPGARVQVAR